MQKKLTLFILILFLVFLTGCTHGLRKMNLKGKITFEGPGHRIWIMDLSTGRCKKIPIKRGAVDPVLSSDGKKVAYCSGGLWVGNVDGSGHRELSGKGISRHPAWSPDGKRIAFWSNRWGTERIMGIYVIDADGENETLITKPAESDSIDWGCSWSPDGKKIAFVVFDDIYTMSPDGSNRIKLTTSRRASCPDWSPDGRRIVFTLRNRGYVKDIYIMDSDGSHQTRLTSGARKGYSNARPKWSPDGKKIFYWVVLIDYFPIFSEYFYAINPDGSGNTRILKFTGFRQIWEGLLYE